jgi:hypothetical protein
MKHYGGYDENFCGVERNTVMTNLVIDDEFTENDDEFKSVW